MNFLDDTLGVGGSAGASREGGTVAPSTRVALARQAYQAAIEAVRTHSTARTWARLLRAARNLRDASTAERQIVQHVRPRP